MDNKKMAQILTANKWDTPQALQNVETGEVSNENLGNMSSDMGQDEREVGERINEAGMQAKEGGNILEAPNEENPQYSPEFKNFMQSSLDNKEPDSSNEKDSYGADRESAKEEPEQEEDYDQ
jgi:hypothetical protein